MGSLTTCIKKAGAALRDDDKHAILARATELRRDGKSADEAAALALDEQIRAVQALLDAAGSASTGPGKSPGEPTPTPPAAAPKADRATLYASQFMGKDVGELFRIPTGTLMKASDLTEDVLDALERDLQHDVDDDQQVRITQAGTVDDDNARVHVDVMPAATAAPAETPATPPHKGPPANPVDEHVVRTMVLASRVKQRLSVGHAMDWRLLFSMADEAFAGTQAEGKYTVKDAYDALEAGVNLYLQMRSALLSTAANPDEALRIVGALEKLTALLPTQTKRTGEQDDMQQFSTPPAFAYVANWVANPTSRDQYLEPSAGVGGLAVFGANAGAQVVTNELAPRRADLLRAVLPQAIDFRENAEQLNNILPASVRPTVVVMNPPFSNSAVRGVTKDTMVGAQHVEQALKRMAPGGRLVAIVGNGMELGKPTFDAWWKAIRSRYDVRAVIPVEGRGYAKYGTTFGNAIIVIDKIPPLQGRQPVTTFAESYTDLVPLLTGVRDDRPNAQPAVDSRGTQQSSAQPTGGRPVQPRPQEAAGGRDAAAGGAGTVGGATAPGGSGVGGSGGAVAVPSGDGRPAGPVLEPVGQRSPGAGDDAGRGEPRDTQPAGGSDPSGQPASVEPDEPVAELTDSVFEAYRPQRLSIPGAQPHPGKLVQSAAMASVLPPTPAYKPNLPRETVAEGKVSLAQLEAVVYAGQAHAQVLANGDRRGFFIGDGTGVGKGREIGAIILDNLRQGRKKAVWISEKQGLMTDAKRDFGGVGGDPTIIFNQNKTNASDAIDVGDGVLFTTYATLRSAAQAPKDQPAGVPAALAPTRLEQLVKWLGKDFDGVIAFDEAHNAGNAIAIKGDRGISEPSEQALKVVELQKALPNARVVYVSATGATEVSNLSFATRLGLWGEGTPFATPDAFIAQMEAGGLATMELVARDMKQMGAYVARSLSFDGVTYSRIDHELTPLQRDIYNRLAESWQVALRNINEALKVTGVVADNGKSLNGRALGAARSAFWSAQQRFFNQIITSMQMPSVVEAIGRDLAAGRAVVLQLVNTNEAQQERALAKSRADDESTELEDLDLTPRDQLLQMVEKAFPTQQYETHVDENGRKFSVPVKDSQGNPVQNAEAVAMRDALLEDLKNIRVPDGPLEILLNEFGADKVAEITGRRQRVVRKPDEKGETKATIEKRGASAVRADADAFMADKKQILVFSDAGGTGFSFHADLSKANQRKRSHYLIQPGWRANKAVQGFGRTHRTNEASEPEYKLVSTNIPAHKRFLSSIARRLDQLGALTKGQRDASSSGLFSEKDNLESKYATRAVRQLLDDVRRGQLPGVSFVDFMRELGLEHIVDADTGQIPDAKYPPTQQFLNRMLSMTLDMQERTFNAFISRMEEQVEMAAQRGELDTGLQTIKALSARVIREETVYTDKRTGAKTNYVELELTQPNRIYSFPNRRAQGDLQFVRNVRSGRVWGTVKSGTLTRRDGSVIDKVRMLGTSGTQVREAAELDKRGSDGSPLFEKMGDEDARALWDKENAERPRTYTERAHMIVGALLPIWDRFPPSGSMQVVRTQTSDGRRLLGRLILENDLEKVMENMGVASAEAKLSPAEVMKRVLGGDTAQLANGWKLAAVTVSGEKRIEFQNVRVTGSGGPMGELERRGIIAERISWSYRYFLPLGAKGQEILAYVFETKPVARIGRPDADGEIQRLQTEEPTAQYRVPKTSVAGAPVQFVSLYDEAPIVRDVAHGLRRGDLTSIASAADAMAPKLVTGDVLIPMPSHDGRATTTLSLARAIAKRMPGVRVVDALSGAARESLYEAKKAGRDVSSIDLGMKADLSKMPADPGRVYVVDGVLATGTTARAAVGALAGLEVKPTLLVYAVDRAALEGKNQPAPAESQPYESDLFGAPLAKPTPRRRAATPAAARNLDATAGVPPEAPSGTYATITKPVAVRQQRLGHAGAVRSLGDAAAAIGYLNTSAVERFDALVTDKDGKPLAVVGGFKGTLSQTSVYPSTVLGEVMQIPGAAHVWPVHNHPSGTSMLSRADEFLAQEMERIFDGTGITLHGVIAVTPNRWSGVDHFTHSSGALKTKPGTTVPVQERGIDFSGRLGPALSGPSDAKDLAEQMVKDHGGQTGIILLDSQHAPIAYIPWSTADSAPLKGNGRLEALYRAVARANAGSAIIVRPGSYGDTSALRAAQNLAAGLSQTDVKVLDIVSAADRGSAAERGDTLKADVLYSQAPNGWDSVETTDQPSTVESARAEVRALFGDKADAVVHVVPTLSGLPPSMRALFNEAGALAVTIDKEQIYLVADRIPRGTVGGIVMHELGVHYGMPAGTIGRMTEQIRTWAKGTGILADMAREALARGEASHSTSKTEEPVAYMVQFLHDSGINPKDGSVERFLRMLRELVDKALNALGLRLSVTPQQMVDYALGAANVALERGRSPKAAATAEFSDEAPRSFVEYAQAGLRGFDQRAARNLFEDLTTSHAASPLFAGLRTQYAKARLHPATFGRVFEAVQDYIKDISVFANAAADAAPGVLPKLETARDVLRKETPKADIEAAGRALWQGTLTDEKVYSRDELNAMGLSPAQQALYRQARAAIDRSLDDLGRSEVVRLAGKDGDDVRPAILGEANLRVAASMMARFLTEKAQDPGTTPEARARLMQTAVDIGTKAAKIEQLKDKGYAPLMRFGRHTVRVEDSQGGTLYFGMYESRLEANQAARALRETFPDATLSQGMMSTEGFRLFGGMNLDALELFAEVTGNADNEVYQDYLRLTKNNRSALKRLIHRQGIAGFSEDMQRVLAAFVTSNARAASGNLHMGYAKQHAEAIPKEMGDLRDDAIRLVSYVQDPQEEAPLLRGLLFANFIGGSVASAAVNLTQPVTMTLPYLSQWGGVGKATGHLLAAARAAAGGSVTGDLAAALAQAEADGIVSPQEIHHLQAEAMGAFGRNPYIKKAAFLWGSLFSLSEQFNRRVTFIAAWNTAREQGMADPFDFAERAVIETQGLYNRGNKPNWARGPIGATVMTFKQFSIHYLEFLSRMWHSGPEGKKAAAAALVIMAFVAGVGGLPFADDLDDLIDTVAQAMGYDFSSKRAKRRFFAETLGLGDVGAEFATRGATALPGLPIDLSLRLGMGNLLPGTGLLLRSNTDKSRDVLEFAGAAGSLAKQASDAAQKLLAGDAIGAGLGMAPKAVQDMAKAAVMWNSGEYRDSHDRKVMNVGATDGAMKFLGFQPQGVARESSRMGEVQRSIALARNVETAIADKWAQALRDKDTAKAAEARAELRDWNAKNPEAPMQISMQQVIQRVRALGQSRADRAVKSAPREMRQDVRQQLQ